jgi:hypothetical protein
MDNKPIEKTWRYVGSLDIAVEMERIGPSVMLRVYARVGTDKMILVESALQDYERDHFHEVTRAL